MTETQRKIVAGIAFGVLALVATFFAGPEEEDQKRAVEQVCAISEALDVPGFTADYCTHGPDPRVDALTGAGEPRQMKALDTYTQNATVQCKGNGKTGYRIAVFYGYPAGTEDRSAAKVPELESYMAAAQVRVDISHNTHTQDLRYLCSAGRPLIRTVELPAIGDDGEFGFHDTVNGLNDAGFNTFGEKSKRIFAVFVDHIAGNGAYPYCGEGTVGGGTDPRWIGGHVALVACFGEHTFLHELGHNMGAVQLAAPHDSGAYHCHESGDVMCYPDGGSYFTRGGRMSPTCGDVMRWDCNLEDYWDPLNDFAWWNTADSPYFGKPRVK